MNLPFDLSAIDTAAILGGFGLIVHWVRRVQRGFVEMHELRYQTDAKLQRLEAMLNEHVKLSDIVWENYGARLSIVERQSYPKGN